MKVIFRCDATAATGLGHLSRSLAIAEALRRAGGEAIFVGHGGDAAHVMLAASGFSHRLAGTPTGTDADADALAQFAALEGADGVFVDSYAIDSRWIARLRAREVAAVLIDDFARLANYGDCAGVINFTVGATGLWYRGLGPERLALGPEYFPARERLVNLRRQRTAAARPENASIFRVLIALGGGDRLQMTVPIYRALLRLRPDVEVRAFMPHGAAAARDAGLPEADFPAPASDLAEHYAWADACVSGGGLTKYECCYLGLPVAIFSQTVEQQAETAQFCAAGLGCDLLADDAAYWEKRLAAFLAGDPATRAAANLAVRQFPSDGPDRAAQMLIQSLSVERVLVRA